MFGNLGIQEILVIALVVVVLFGSKRVPEFTKTLGESAREFNKGLKDDPPKKSHAKTKPDPEGPPPSPAPTNQPSKPDEPPKEVN